MACVYIFINKHLCKVRNKTIELTSIRSDRGSFCCCGMGTACGTHCVICGETLAVAADGSVPNIVGTNCPGAKYGL